MKLRVVIIILSLLIFTGCSFEQPEKPEGLVELKDAMLLEVSLLGEYKHWTVRTIDEEIVVIKIDWDKMPTPKVGEQLDLEYTEKDNMLYEYTVD